MRTKFLLLTLSGLFFACDMSDDVDTMLSENSFVARRDNGTWTGTTEIGLTANDTLIFLGRGEGLDNGVVVARVKFDGVGRYRLDNHQGIYYNTLGGDVLISSYAIGQGSEGVLSITEYNEQNGQIKGSLEMPLKATFLYGTGLKDSTLVVSDGRFNGFVVEGLLH